MGLSFLEPYANVLIFTIQFFFISICLFSLIKSCLLSSYHLTQSQYMWRLVVNQWQRRGRSITFLLCHFGDNTSVVISASVLLLVVLFCLFLAWKEMRGVMLRVKLVLCFTSFNQVSSLTLFEPTYDVFWSPSLSFSLFSTYPYRPLPSPFCPSLPQIPDVWFCFVTYLV